MVKVSHGDHRIDQDREIGPRTLACDRLGRVGLAQVKLGAGRRCQMATRREPDDAHPLRVDLPFPGVQSDSADGLLRIEERHLRAPCRQAVFQHGTQDAVLVEPTRDPVAFRAGHQPAVSAARADDHSHPIGLGGRMDGQTGVLWAAPATGSIRSPIGPERKFGRGGGLCGDGRRAHRAQQCCDERGK